jgi:diguanylate cyclase (GGDEF)-like protein
VGIGGLSQIPLDDFVGFMMALTVLTGNFWRRRRFQMVGWGAGLLWTLVAAAVFVAWDVSHGPVVAGYAVLWLLGLGGIVVGYRRMDVQIAKRKRATARITYLAGHDALTQLPNRHLFFDRPKGTLAEAGRKGERIALLSLDLDGFRAVNDILGQKAGDLVLREVAHRLLAVVRETDVVARVGGDEFAVLLGNLADAHVVARVANEIIEAIGTPMHLPGEDLAIGASMGIAFAPDDAESPEDLVRAADAAMQEVKELEKTGFNFAGAGGAAAVNRSFHEKRRASLYG